MITVVAHIHPFSPHKRIEKNYEAGTTLEHIITDLHVPPNGLPIILVDGIKTDDIYNSPADGASVVIRNIPRGAGNTNTENVGIGKMAVGAAAFLVGIALFPFGVGAGIISALVFSGIGLLALGGITYSMLSIYDPIKTFASESLPSLRGGQNKASKWGKIPLVLGKHLVVPNLAAAQYTEVATSSGGTDGDTQYLRQLFCLGYAPLKISQIKLGENLLSTNASDVRNGAIDTSTGIYADVELEIYQDGTASALYPDTVLEDAVAAQLPSGEETWRTTDESCTKISWDIWFPMGIYKVVDGVPANKTVTIEVRSRAVGSGTAWASCTLLQTLTLTKANATTLRYSSSATVASGQYEVGVKRITADDAGQEQSAATWMYLRSIKTTVAPVAADVRSRHVYLAVKAKASDTVNGALDTLSCVAEAVAPDYSGTGSGSASWVSGTTANPAAMLLLALRGTSNPRPVADTKIDWARLEEFHAFCETNGHACNAVVSGGLKLRALLQQIAQCGRASLIMRDGLYSVVIDSARTTIVQHFTPRNVRDFRWTRAFDKIPHALRMSFISEADSWTASERLVCDDDYTEETATEIEKVDVWGITDEDAVWKKGRYLLAGMRLRPEMYQFETDAEGIVCEPGDLVAVAHDAIVVGLVPGARIKSVTVDGSGNATALVLDTPCPMEAGGSYGVRVRLAGGTSVYRAVTTAAGEQTTITLATSIPAATVPAVGDLVTFGEADIETIKCIVIGYEALEDLGVRIYCVDQADAIHSADSGTIPAYVSHVSRPPAALPQSSSDEDIAAGLAEARAAQLAARALAISGANAFKYASGAGVPVPTNLTLTATPNAFTPSTYQWQYHTGSAWANLGNEASKVSGVTTSALTIYYNATVWGSAASLRLRCLADSEVWEEITLLKVADGAAGEDGNDGNDGLGYSGLTSATSVAIGTGSKAFTVNQSFGSNAYIVGNRVRFAYNASNWMEGTVTAYSGTTMTVSVDLVGGSGTYASWTVSIAGVQGTAGATGAQGVPGGQNYPPNWDMAYSDVGTFFSGTIERVTSASVEAGCPFTYCLKSTIRDVNARTAIPVVAGQKYKLEAWVNASLAAYHVNTGLFFKPTEGGTAFGWATVKTIAPGTAGWIKVSGTITVPATATLAYFWGNNNGYSAFGSAYWTGITVSRTEAALDEAKVYADATVKATTGLGFRYKASTFTDTNDGEIYMHGFTAAGVAADVDGFVYLDNTKITVTKGMVNPNLAIDGYLLLPVAGGSVIPGIYNLSGDKFQSANGSIADITEANYVAIGEICLTGSETLESASLYERPLRLAELKGKRPARFIGIASTVATGVRAVTVWETATGGGGYIFSGSSTRQARPGDCVFCRGGTNASGSSDTVKALRVYDGYYWNAPTTAQYATYRELGLLKMAEAARVYNTAGVALPADIDAAFDVLVANQVFTDKLAARVIKFMESVSADKLATAGSLTAGDSRISMGYDPAVPRWTAGATVGLGYIIREAGNYYTCSTAGTTGSAAPSWPTSGTVNDGTAVWRFVSAAEYEFAVSKYLGTVGGNEVWQKQFLTKALRYGLIGLLLIGGIESCAPIYSDPGRVWYRQDSPFGTSAVWAVAYGNGKWVAVGYGGKIAYSTTGKTWTPVASSPFGTSAVWAVAYGNGKWVAVGYGGKIAYSTTGETWTLVASSPFGTTTVWAVAYGNGKWVAGATGDKIAYSTTGETWTLVSSSPFTLGGAARGIAYGAERWIVCCGREVAYSSNGETWTLVSPTVFGSGYLCNSVAYGNGAFVATGGRTGASGWTAYSSDGLAWTLVSPTQLGTSHGISVVNGNGRWVVVGEDGKIVHSYSSSEWSASAISPYGTDGYYASAAYSDDQKRWVVVGYLASNNSGIIITSDYLESGMGFTSRTIDANGEAYYSLQDGAKLYPSQRDYLALTGSTVAGVYALLSNYLTEKKLNMIAFNGSMTIAGVGNKQISYIKWAGSGAISIVGNVTVGTTDTWTINTPDGRGSSIEGLVI